MHVYLYACVVSISPRQGLADLDVTTFCRRLVDPMDEESDHIQIVALTNALHVPLRVVYLDRSADSGLETAIGTNSSLLTHVATHDFLPEGCGAPTIHLLYRPGHYDILYPKAGT